MQKIQILLLVPSSIVLQMWKKVYFEQLVKYFCYFTFRSHLKTWLWWQTRYQVQKFVHICILQLPKLSCLLISMVYFNCFIFKWERRMCECSEYVGGVFWCNSCTAWFAVKNTKSIEQNLQNLPVSHLIYWLSLIKGGLQDFPSPTVHAV